MVVTVERPFPEVSRVFQVKLDHRGLLDLKDLQDLLGLRALVCQALWEIQAHLALQDCLELVNLECQACQGILVILDHPDLKENRDPVEKRGKQVYQDHLGSLDLQGCQELGSQVSQDHQDCQEAKENQGTKVYLVCQACLGQKGKKE
ncbi:hypothetical protein MHYP_G00071130 [Metynnis hypsauchen]